MNEKAHAALRKVRYFAELPQHIQADIAEAAVLRRFNAGEVIYLQGEPADALFILGAGWVKSIRLSPEGREQALLFLRPGEIFGDVAVFTGASYPGTVLALEPVEAWSIGRQKVLQLIGQHEPLALATIRRLGERILYYVELVEDLTLRSVETRLAHTLLHHAEVQDGQLIVPRRPWTTFDEMATRLGTVRDVLGRTLRALEEEGIIRVERQAILILKPEELTRRGDS